MTTPPEPERSNLAWVTSLRADSEAAWAAIRQQVHRSLVAYLRRNRPAGICQLTPRLVEAASRLSHCLIGFLQIPARHQSLGMKRPVSLRGRGGSDDRLFLPGEKSCEGVLVLSRLLLQLGQSLGEGIGYHAAGSQNGGPGQRGPPEPQKRSPRDHVARPMTSSHV
jgi:hypothetical protein